MKDGASEFASATAQNIIGIQAYGDSWWTASNGMMKEDHLYTWDVNQNATFPAKVTAATMNATTFTGALSGNAATATKATQDESGNNIKTSYAASMSLSGTTLSLLNKNSTALSTVTLAIPSSAADIGAASTGDVTAITELKFSSGFSVTWTASSPHSSDTDSVYSNRGAIPLTGVTAAMYP